MWVVKFSAVLDLIILWTNFIWTVFVNQIESEAKLWIFVFRYICPFHLLVQKYFGHPQNILTKFNISWTHQNVFELIFYLTNLHIWVWWKLFDHIQKMLNTIKVTKTIFELADGLGNSRYSSPSTYAINVFPKKIA